MTGGIATGTVREERTGGSVPRVRARLAEGLEAAVTTRPLDFGRHTDTAARQVSAAHRALRAWAGRGFEIVVEASQVHGARLFAADRIRVPEPGGRIAPATIRVANYDGFHTATPGILLTVGVADCVPAFLCAPSRGVVALLHAGWRGVAAEIVPRALATLASEHGVGPAEVRVWWGPAIGPCCYPVGAEVVDGIGATAAGADPAAWMRDGDDGVRVDLRAALTLQAVAVGVPAEAIASSPRCTACDPELHSYRRERGGGGRMLALAGFPRSRVES